MKLARSELEVVAGVDRWALATILAELKEEQDCAHSWRRYVDITPPSAAVDALVLAEQRARPTVFFTYWGRTGERKGELVGAATIAEKISSEFDYAGFPVIARAYLRRRFRRQRLYAAMLDHRLDYCERRWQGELNAIHLGASSPAVVRCLSSARRSSPGFVQIGTEQLDLGGSRVEVGAFLAFTEPFLARVRAAAPAGEARDALDALLSGGGRGPGLASLRAHLLAAAGDDPGLRGLVELGDLFAGSKVSGT